MEDKKIYVLELAPAAAASRMLMIVGAAKEPAYEMVERWISHTLDDAHDSGLYAYIGKQLKWKKKAFEAELTVFAAHVELAAKDPVQWLTAAESWCKLTGHVIELHHLEVPA